MSSRSDSEADHQWSRAPGACIWLTGRSGAGKTTITAELVSLLQERGRTVTVLDTVTELARRWYEPTSAGKLRRKAEAARAVVEHGDIAICVTISACRESREAARAVIGADRFVEVFVDAPAEVSAARKAARNKRPSLAKRVRSLIRRTSGIARGERRPSYEPPLAPDLRVDTSAGSPADAARAIVRRLDERGLLSPADGRARSPREPAGRPRRHCMIVYAYYPVPEPRVLREAAALTNAGYEVDVICLRKPGEPARERYRDVEIHRLPMGLDKRSLWWQFLSYARFTVRAGTRLTRLHLRRRYGSVQVHNLPDFLVFCALVPKLLRVPVVLDLHDLLPEFYAGRFGERGPRVLPFLIRLQERLACRFADHVITVSEHWRRTLIERGVPEDRCSVVMNAPDGEMFAPGRRPRGRRDGIRLVYHGNITHRYGVDLALRAVALVRDQIPGIRLTVLGRGDGLKEVLELRSNLQLEDVVDVRTDYIPTEEMLPMIAAADLGVVPYRGDVFTDGIVPTKLMEYAAIRIPCVAARTTAIERYFSGTMVEFFEPGDAGDLAQRIAGLHARPERRAELARRSQTFTRRYNWARLGAEYVALIDRLAAGTGHSNGDASRPSIRRSECTPSEGPPDGKARVT